MAKRGPRAQYILDRLNERLETPDEFARRVGINSSGFYKLLRGEYAEPRQATLDKIASGIGMTPAELLVAVRGGSSELSTDELELLADYRQVEPNQKPTVKQIIRGLRAKTHLTRTAKAPRRALNGRSDTDDSTLDDTLQSHLKALHPLKAFASFSS
jgi:transcriptional regulator with XRE-family HTH domain